MEQMMVLVRLDDLKNALQSALSNPYLFDGNSSETDWITRFETTIKEAEKREVSST